MNSAIIRERRIVRRRASDSSLTYTARVTFASRCPRRNAISSTLSPARSARLATVCRKLCIDGTAPCDGSDQTRWITLRPDLPSREDVRDTISTPAKPADGNDHLAVQAAMAAPANPRDRMLPRTVNDRGGQVVQIVRCNRENPRECLGLSPRMPGMQRVAGELVVDAVRAVGIRTSSLEFDRRCLPSSMQSKSTTSWRYGCRSGAWPAGTTGTVVSLYQDAAAGRSCRG
jgi:hypothetical protein